MFRAAMTSASVMAAGDALCQAVEHRSTAALSSSTDGDGGNAEAGEPSTSYRAVTRRTIGFEHDAERTGRFFIVGAGLHGPMFHRASTPRPRRRTGTCAKTVATKVAVGHAVLFPTYTTMFFRHEWAGGGDGDAGVRTVSRRGDGDLREGRRLAIRERV